MTTDTDNPTAFTLRNDDGEPLTFQGWLLAAVTSRDGSPVRERWHTAIDLYRTSEGRFVVLRETVRDNEKRTDLRVFNSRRSAQDWLGFGSLSLLAYSDAGWPL